MAQNQVQQQNNAQLQQLDVNEAQQADSIAASANKPASSSQSGAPSQSVTAQADAAIVPASPAPAAPPALAAKSTQSETVEVSGRALDKLKVVPESLPSKLGVLSQTRSGKTTVAIDTAGSVFASDDGGKHWQSANTQWSGRPILVKTRPASESGGGGLLKQSTPRFELTTDKHEIWVSEDGKNWTLEPLTGR